MKKYILISLIILSACQTDNDKFYLQKGDLLFQDLDSSPLCDAIEIVTPGYKGANLSHVGIIIEDEIPFCTNPDSKFEDKYFYNIKQNVKVLEALPGGVKITKLDSFLNRSFDNENNPKVIVARVKKQYKHNINDAISFLKKKIGAQYDHAFIINNNMYYCSEIIYEAFLNDSIFELKPMTFLNPETGDTLQVWKDYYTDLGMKIPQNEPGINPGIMSLSENIDIVHIYGSPDGIQINQ